MNPIMACGLASLTKSKKDYSIAGKRSRSLWLLQHLLAVHLQDSFHIRLALWNLMTAL